MEKHQFVGSKFKFYHVNEVEGDANLRISLKVTLIGASLYTDTFKKWKLAVQGQII